MYFLTKFLTFHPPFVLSRRASVVASTSLTKPTFSMISSLTILCLMFVLLLVGNEAMMVIESSPCSYPKVIYPFNQSVSFARAEARLF